MYFLLLSPWITNVSLPFLCVKSNCLKTVITVREKFLVLHLSSSTCLSTLCISYFFKKIIFVWYSIQCILFWYVSVYFLLDLASWPDLERFKSLFLQVFFKPSTLSLFLRFQWYKYYIFYNCSEILESLFTYFKRMFVLFDVQIKSFLLFCCQAHWQFPLIFIF